MATGACVNEKPDNKNPAPAPTPTTSQEAIGMDPSRAFFVTQLGTKDKDCTTWEKACDLQTAIDKAYEHTTKKVVLVEAGSYFADPAKTDETKTFILKSGVEIYGSIIDRNDLTKRNMNKKSILEGKLSEHKHTKQILKGENLSEKTILDSFLIQNALNADDGSGTSIKGGGLYLRNSSPKLISLSFENNKLTGKNSYGGAIFNDIGSNPSITSSVFSKNSAKEWGGAIHIEESNPIISKLCYFSNNSAKYGGAISINYEAKPKITYSLFTDNSAVEGGGGAIYIKENSEPTIIGSFFTDNSSTGTTYYGGGAIYNDYSTLKISNSKFTSSNSETNGGAIYNNLSNLIINNSAFVGNSTPKSNGGAIYNFRTTATISNSTFKDNFAELGGAIFNANAARVNISNSILWNNKNKSTTSEVVNNIYNHFFNYADTEYFDPETTIKNSILNANSVVNEVKSLPKKVTKNYDFMDSSKPEFKKNQAPANFVIEDNDKITDATSQSLIKNKGDNALYLEVYDKIHGKTGTSKIPADDKDIGGDPRLKGANIDIGAYELQD